jgi:sulfur relay (sulfurtransferase) complex TusBCD TusD component (DsrE family)
VARSDQPNDRSCLLSVSPTVGCYGSERAFNELRPAGSLAKRESAEARVFLTIDADKVLVL